MANTSRLNDPEGGLATSAKYRAIAIATVMLLLAGCAVDAAASNVEAARTLLPVLQAERVTLLLRGEDCTYLATDDAVFVTDPADRTCDPVLRDIATPVAFTPEADAILERLDVVAGEAGKRLIHAQVGPYPGEPDDSFPAEARISFSDEPAAYFYPDYPELPTGDSCTYEAVDSDWYVETC